MEMTDTEFKVEKGVALPKHIKGRGRHMKYPFDKMEPEDSFQYPPECHNEVRSSADSYGRRHGMKFRSMMMEDGTYRCFRVS